MTSPKSDESDRERSTHQEQVAERRGGDFELSELEYWVWATGVLGLCFVAAWGVALLRLGGPSIYAHVFAVPIVGGLTLPVALWGIMRTVFRPPIFRVSRLAGFAGLVTIGFFGNVPLFPAPVSTTDWQSEHEYRLPFEGEWYTLAGGSEVDRNYHATTAAYRWAYDFAPVRDGSRFRGDGETLEDYYCWGRDVLAPAAGRVVALEDDRKDFPPREFDESSVYGNYVVVRVEPEEYLYVAHLKKGSVAVDPGDELDRGQRIGACGNSGRAVEPHVHVHLQDRRGFPVAESLPLRFSDYRTREAGRVDRGMPVGEGEGGQPKGQFVEYVGPP